jgi:peptide/nickel transport system substrate-binding protein
VAILVVVILVVGGLGYVGLNSGQGSNSTTTPATCAPATNSICKTSAALNDVELTVPFTAGYGQAFPVVTTSTLVSAYVSLKNGELANEFSVNWGDGAPLTNTTSSTQTHFYQSIGTYVISAQALVGTTWHSGPGYLYPIQVTPSLETISNGYVAPVTATLSNATGGSVGWLEGSGSVTVSASYAAAPSDTQFVNNAPSLMTPAGSTQSAYTHNGTSASASYAFDAPGVYAIDWLGSSAGPGGVVAFDNYTWTVVVTLSGLVPACGGCSVLGQAKSPHPGTLDIYEVTPGGATTIDPALEYDSVSGEVVLNIFQTLITYNGSLAGPTAASMVPELATCVPGSALCQQLYGSSLINPSAQYFTFVIDPAAHFYDPATKASWGVYPSDVFFSLARTLGFADLPGVAETPGWIQAQALLPETEATAGTIHFPFDNEPQMILDSMLVNDSAYCPAIAMTQDHGCITFNTAQSGATWPEFLTFIADSQGASIVSCGWDSAQGATVPGFVGSSAPHGDGPCLLPGGVNNTQAAGFTNYVAAQTPTSWDGFEDLALNLPSVQPNVRFNAVGSGPYYLVSINNGIGYFLQANPGYHAPTGCAGQEGCEPLPGQYASTANVFWEPSDTIGIQEYYAGRADYAVVSAQDIPTMLSLERQGLLGVLTNPTIDIAFYAYDLDMDISQAQSDVGSAGTINVPANFFAYDGLRQFLSYAYPYQTIENTLYTVDGIQEGFNYGGAIPYGMGNYYPTNISWPSTNPDTNPADVGGAAWWWAQATNPSSIYYDSELAKCTPSTPCYFPILGEEGAPAENAAIALYIPLISSLTGGALQPFTVELTFSDLIQGLYATAGNSGLSVVGFAWAPDYPDPSDYVNGAMYSSESAYTGPDAVNLELNQPQFDRAGPACGGVANSVDPTTGVASWAALAYWTAQTSTTGGQGIPTVCQGVAYDVALYWMGVAAGSPTATLADANYRVLLYNMVEHIMNGLNLYIYDNQENGLASYAPWIDPATVNVNVMLGAGGMEPWYAWNGNGVSG